MTMTRSAQVPPLEMLFRANPVEISTAPQAGPALGRVVNPLDEPGWDSLLDTHAESCFFHTSAWARVLHETYGHEPVYFCEIRNRQLLGLLPVMEIRRPCLGRCGVSLPFTDLCPVLFGEPGWDPYKLAVWHGRTRGWKWLECRSRNHRWPGAIPSLSFYAHSITLEGDPQKLLRKVKGTVRTAIKKAQSSGLRIEFEQSGRSLDVFYRLHSLTRRRHGLPPQPRRFFDSIARHVLARGQGVVVSALSGQEPVAAAMFFYRKGQAFFKFGASDYRFQNLRPNNLLMWEAMKWLQERGIGSLHLGRTSLTQAGLRRFKLGFGAEEEPLEYFRYSLPEMTFVAGVDRAHNIFNSVFRLLPLPLLRLSGALLYPRLPG